MNLFVSVFRGFRRRKANLLFPVLGVAVGVMLVVLVSTVGAVGKAEVSSEISGLGLGGLMISAGEGTGVLTQGELQTVRSSQVIAAATPIVYSYSQIKCVKNSQECLLWGVDDYTDEIMNLSLVYGRNISKGDVLSVNKVCLVDASYAREVYGRENIVGKKIELSLGDGTHQFTVVGITDGEQSLIKNVVSQFVPCFVYIPYTVMRGVSGDDFFDSIAVNVRENIDFSQAETALSKKLSEYSGMTGAYRIENMFNQTQTIEKVLNIITIVLSGIAAISLVVSGMSVMTVMLFSVGERTHEIGIKKAIGASFSDILFEFLAESVVITLIGCIVGIAGGVFASFAGCKILGIAPVFDRKMILICIAVTAFFGLLFGIYPAIRAARLDPATALRQN